MPRLFVANFDFEHHLAGVPHGRLTEPVRRINHELAAAWVGVADEGDFVLCPAGIEEGFFDEMRREGLPQLIAIHEPGDVPEGVELVPWGWTDELRELARRHRWQADAPPDDVVRQANSRRFSFALEQEWNCGLAGAAVVRSLHELHAALQTSPLGWVVKAEFSMSARERLLGRGTELSTLETNWVARRLRGGKPLFFEPWVERLEEVALQFTIPKSGRPVLEGVTPLLADPIGNYVGSRIGGEWGVASGEWGAGSAERGTRSAERKAGNAALRVPHSALRVPQSAIAPDLPFRAAARLQELGYFGPLGIDAMRYRDADGAIRVRWLQDINARWTMGRLALGFRRLLAADAGRRSGNAPLASWLHVRWSEGNGFGREWFDRLRQQLPPDVRLLRTSPWEIAGRPTQHGTLLVIAPTLDKLETVEKEVLAPLSRHDLRP